MADQIVLLRGVNIGSHNRVAMPALRDALRAEGYENVRTYVASGNVVLDSGEKPDALERACEALIERAFGLKIAVIVRTRAQLASVVKRDPFGSVASTPKLYSVTFLTDKPERSKIEALRAFAAGGEQLELAGRELYSWHPDGVGRSKLATKLAAGAAGVTGTTRNWTTVTKLLELASA